MIYISTVCTEFAFLANMVNFSIDSNKFLTKVLVNLQEFALLVVFSYET